MLNIFQKENSQDGYKRAQLRIFVLLINEY